jgi:hypothetical protein
MNKKDECRTFAALCLNIATKTTDTADKARLLAMAEAWLNLADRASRLEMHPIARIVDHPLVAKILRRYFRAELD